MTDWTKNGYARMPPIGSLSRPSLHSDNVPTMLNDKNLFFPNLPPDLRSGIPQKLGSDNQFWMLTANTAYDYDTRTTQIKGAMPISKFLRCDELNKSKNTKN